MCSSDLFGSRVEIVHHINENPLNRSTFNPLLSREHWQREEIVEVWKRMGMQPSDIGMIADTDEIFTRDFLRAMQECDGIKAFEYHKHLCDRSQVKVLASTLVFESSPECITQKRQWFHPDAIIGHCIQGIADNTAADGS